jgi:SSS family solute:Na+ symporter
MSTYLIIILAYLIALTVLNFIRSRRIKSQEQFMVAGRSLKWQVMVFTLICTWIGSGTFISGAEFASKAGFSALWLAAGAWVGIILIYFLAAKIHTFGQYTVGDVLEVRYGPAARLFGAIALILSFVSIVSYQFVAGGFILNVITDGKISEATGTLIAAAFVILFTALGGMVAIAYTDLPNGIIIVVACLLAVPFVVTAAGGLPAAKAALEPGYFAVVNSHFGVHPWLKAIGYFLSTMFLLLGVQSMYQKFYSAKSGKDAKKAVAWWTVGTIFVETIVVVIAVFAFSKLKGQIDLSIPKAGGKVVLMAAKQLVPFPVGVLLLGAACAVVISTGMNYLLSPSTTLMRDIYQRFMKKDANPFSHPAQERPRDELFRLHDLRRSHHPGADRGACLEKGDQGRRPGLDHRRHRRLPRLLRSVQDPWHSRARRRPLGHSDHLSLTHRLARRPGHRQPAHAEIQTGSAGEVLS